MKNFFISTDNTCDLSHEILEERGIPTAKLHFYLDDVEQDNTKPFDSQTYYDAMDNGAVTATSLCNQEDTLEMFSSLLSQGKDVVHIAFSSALSGTYHSATMAAEIANANSENKVYVIDSLAGSAGLGLLVTLVDDYANEGHTAKEVAEYAESIKQNMCHSFCLDTVKYAFRGGRVAKIAGWLGSKLRIRLYMHCDDKGRLIVIRKVFSRQKLLDAIVNAVAIKYNGMSDRAYICHAVCQDDAQYIADQVSEKVGITPIIMPLGPIIGSHGGAGALAIFYTGTDKDRV